MTDECNVSKQYGSCCELLSLTNQTSIFINQSNKNFSTAACSRISKTDSHFQSGGGDNQIKR